MTIPITVFGLGLMGRPIARNLIAAGYPVRGWNRSPLPAELIHDLPLVASISQAAQCKVCIFMLSDSNAVDAVLNQLEPHLAAGQLVIDMGTSNPRHSQAHAARLAAKNISWVDAPVSGGPEGATAGTLTIMAGGNTEDFARAKPILQTIGVNVTHVGGPGAGHIVKIINQLIVGITLEAVAEALTLAEKLDVDPRLVQQALASGFADSKPLQLHGTRMIQRAYVPGGKAKTQLKDLQLAAELAASVSAKLPHLESTLALYNKLVAQGNGELDHSAVHKLLWALPPTHLPT